MNELLGQVFQGISALALLKLCVDLGKVLKTIEQHGERIERIEKKVFP